MLCGELRAIASKSHAHRLLICAAFSKEPCEIICRDVSDDILATVSCLNALGAEITRKGSSFFVRPVKTVPDHADIDCRESGSTLRFLLPVVCVLGISCRIFMSGRLPSRPLSPLYEELIRHGAILSNKGLSPLCVSGKTVGNEYSIKGVVSSQFISGLMLSLAVRGGGAVNIISELQSASYIEMTCECLRKSDIIVKSSDNRIELSGKPALSGVHEAEGDWSNAAFWLCAGAVGAEPVTVSGLDVSSAQGDKRVVSLLRELGSGVTVSGDSVTVSPAPLHAVSIDASDIPDLVPILALVCCAADGISRIYNAGRLRFKESDRIKAVTEVLSAFGADIRETADGFIIHGGKALHGARVSSFGDHRIAMTAAVASLLCSSEIILDGAEAVGKSYPDFFNDFKLLGGRTEFT